MNEIIKQIIYKWLNLIIILFKCLVLNVTLILLSQYFVIINI